MKKEYIFRTLIFMGILFLNNIPRPADALDIQVTVSSWVSTLDYYRSLGYYCYRTNTTRVPAAYKSACTKTFYSTYVASYGAYQNDYRTLTGYANYATSSYSDVVNISSSNTPFIYFQNPPDGNLSLKLSSQLNKYYPKPDFNQESGWKLDSKNGKVSLDGEEKDNLFYELETKKITLNRNGKNFSSKEEITSYLKDSDFLAKLGLSEIEKKNSLEYFLPKLVESKNTNYYYLTVVSDKAIAEISDLNVNPKPRDVVRQYFAVYPTPVPVKTEGGFNFPENKSNKSDDYVVKETGEFLVKDSMQVFFE